MKRTINYNKIANELILEIKESFHAFKSDRDYLDKIQVLTAEKGSNGKRTWINLFTKEKGEYRLNDENINIMIRVFLVKPRKLLKVKNGMKLERHKLK